MNPTDTFFVIGLTSEDVLTDVDFGILKLSDYSLKNSMELNQRFGPLRPAIRKGLLVEEEGEVFFLFDATDFEGAQIYKQQFGDKYFEIKFLNDVAFRLCHDYGIKLPPVLKIITRAELPEPQYLGVSMRFRYCRIGAAVTGGTGTLG